MTKRWRKCVGVVGVAADTLEAVGGLFNSCHEMFCALGSGSRFSVIPQASHCLLKRSLSVFRRSHDELWQTSGSHLKSGSGCAEDAERTHCIFGCRRHEYLLRSSLPSSLLCLPVYRSSQRVINATRGRVGRLFGLVAFTVVTLSCRVVSAGGV